MADFANAVVKFKIRPEFKDAFEKAFKNVHDLKCDYLDFGFDHITTTGKYMEKYDEDCDYLNFDVRVGCNFNLEGEFSIPVEQGINGKEVECAILDGKEAMASTVGEIMSAQDFYSFDAKYNIPESKTVIPAQITEAQIEEIRKLAVIAFKAIDGNGLSRVDFFVEKETNKIYINEINTMPGFTKISMYPKLFEAVGVSYSELLDKLIQNAIK